MHTSTIELSSTFGIFLARHQRSIGKTDEEMATALGFSTVKVYKLILSGQMKLPLSKLRVTAQALGITEGHVLRALVEGYCGADVAGALDTVWGTTKLSDNEQKLVEAYRALAANQDVELKVLDGSHVIALLTT